MPRSSSLFLFPDVNVWIALAWHGHIHHPVSARWFATLENDARLCFCRITQLSFLRLLTTESVMRSDVRSQAEAWQVYDQWLDDPRVAFLEEPHGLEQILRTHSRLKHPAPRDWADAYLLAFALVSGLRLVTFDQAFRGKTDNLVLLGA
jgi:toxin-antitoxin system PIN domain toxin